MVRIRSFIVWALIVVGSLSADDPENIDLTGGAPEDVIDDSPADTKRST